jgi:hypothetical protein
MEITAELARVLHAAREIVDMWACMAEPLPSQLDELDKALTAFDEAEGRKT